MQFVEEHVSRSQYPLGEFKPATRNQSSNLMVIDNMAIHINVYNPRELYYTRLLPINTSINDRLLAS